MPSAQSSFPLAATWRSILAMQPRQELKELYVFTLLFSFASALITIFEPVFFFQEGFSLSRISLYYALHYTLYGLLIPFGGKFASRFGLERSLAVSMPLFVLYFLTLAAIPFQPQLFWVALAVLSLFKMFYWPAYHADFAKFTDHFNRGTEISWMSVVEWVGGIIGPVVGGVVAVVFGFPTLFLLAAATALCAGIPLLRTKERYRIQTYEYLDPWKIILSRQHRRMVLGMISFGENLIDLVFWPIFLFLILGSADRLGVVASVTIFVMTVLGMLIGEISDRFPRRLILRMHLPFFILSYLFRPFAAGALRALLTDLLARMSYIGVRIPTMYYLYKQGRRFGALRYAIAFELVLIIVKATLAWVLVWVFAAFLPYTGFTVAFFAAALFALFYVFF